MTTPSLRYFVLRDESKRLYKKFMAVTRNIDDPEKQKEMRCWIRDDFKLNKNLTNEIDIRSQHIRARAALEELETFVSLSKAQK